MKPLIKFLFFFITLTTCYCQAPSTLSFTHFETDFFTYQPIQKEGVSDDHFSFAKFVISEVKNELNNDVKNYTAIHYWNIITALDKLKVDKSILIFAFQKMFEKEGSCNYILNFKGKATFYDSIPAMYDFYYSNCQKNN
ncbi:hypothetical protein ACFS5M_11000 [Lacinutrix iliipiscaria]|uniref:DUF4476 domain-containing protein n=1 Tax=Lacinutrix iliipiscaria TaxID=1230532 RepID=A0ABW5WQM0_9FLAO